MARALRPVLALAAAGVLAAGGAWGAPPDDRAAVGMAAMALTRDTVWTQVSATPIDFDAFHPQGMVRVGDALFVSSVQILERTRRYPETRDGFDRDQGRGQGWLFKMDLQGRLLASLKLGEGAMYHPGGLDFDGRHLWVPSAEYRSGGPSILYRVDSETLTAIAALRIADHIGALAWDPATRSLMGASWGSRTFYRWKVGVRGEVMRTPPTVQANPAHYIDHQDCKGAGPRRVLCSGLATYPSRSGLFELGGVELIDITTLRPVWQAPVKAWTPAGSVMTSNAATFESVAGGLRGRFLPEDGRGVLYVYEARTSR